MLGSIAITVHVLCAALAVQWHVEESLTNGVLAALKGLKWFVPTPAFCPQQFVAHQHTPQQQTSQRTSRRVDLDAFEQWLVVGCRCRKLLVRNAFGTWQAWVAGRAHERSLTKLHDLEAIALRGATVFDLRSRTISVEGEVEAGVDSAVGAVLRT